MFLTVEQVWTRAQKRQSTHRCLS